MSIAVVAVAVVDVDDEDSGEEIAVAAVVADAWEEEPERRNEKMVASEIEGKKFGDRKETRQPDEQTNRKGQRDPSDLSNGNSCISVLILESV